MSAETPGTVVRYDSERLDGWCREGMAVADAQGTFVDTYWSVGVGDDHVLTASEAATAQTLFHLAAYRELLDAERHSWHSYHPDDRQVITSQHGLVVRYFVRIGAAPDHGTRVENAREAVLEAAEQVESAQRALTYRREELARLEATS
jgi:hypothetical protein